MSKYLVLVLVAGLGACATENATTQSASNSTATTTAPRAATGNSMLIGQSAEGMKRVCTYAGQMANGEPRQVRTGLGQPCPFVYPAADPRSAPPPTAVLDGSTIENGRRSCIYVQEPNRWTVTLPLTEICPLNAGMARQAAARAAAQQ